MKHYVCDGGCEGVSEKPGVCQDPDCAKHDKPLTECNCTDGKHEAVLGEGEKKPKQQKTA